MADNVEANTGSGGAVFKTDEDTGASAHVPVTKIELGANSSFDGYVSSSNPMPTGGPAAENAAVSGNPVLTGGRYDATPRTLGDGDVGAVALDPDGAVHIADGGNTITVGGTVTANLSATDNAVLDQLEVNTSYGDSVGGGTEAAALRVTLANNSTGLLSVDDNGGSLTVDGTVTANAGTGTMTVDLGANNDVQGDVAHDAADSGNPVKIGAKVETSIEGVTLAVDGDRTDLYADADGVLVVKPHTTGADLVSERVSDTGGTSTAFTNFSAVASVYNYVTTITITNTSATDGYVDFRDGTAGSVKWTAPIPANGGVTIACGGVPLFKTSANTALAYDVSAALTTVYISVSGFQSKV